VIVYGYKYACNLNCQVVETGAACLSGAYVDLYEGATQSTNTSQVLIYTGSYMNWHLVYTFMKQCT